MLSENDLYGWQCRLASRVKSLVRHAALKAQAARGVLVFVDMGQGKTAPSLTAIYDCIDAFLASKVLVIAPIKICEAVWRQEALKWSHLRDMKFSLVRGNAADRSFAIARNADVYLVNPEHLDWLYKQLRGDFSKFQLIFWDESSLAKNPRSKRFKTMKKIRDKHEEIVIVPMTGTPRPNSIMDLWTQVYMVDGGERLGYTFTQFRAKFFKPGRKLADHVYEWSEDEGAFQRIKELIADITLELSDDERKKFPIVPVDHYVELPPPVREAYDRLESKMVFEWGESVIVPKHGGAKSIMLRQMAAGAVYKNRLLGVDHDELHREKLDYLLELLEELNRQVIITVEFKHDVERLRALLPKSSAVFAKGNTDQTIKDWQRGNIGQLLMHPASAGFGLDGLQDGGNHVIFFNETWSQQNHDQLIARLARTGQGAAQVFSHYLRARDTVEDLMRISRHVKGDEQSRFRTALRLYQAQKGLL